MHFLSYAMVLVNLAGTELQHYTIDSLDAVPLRPGNTLQMRSLMDLELAHLLKFLNTKLERNDELGSFLYR